MVFSLIFGSSSSELSNRIEAMRNAEITLMQLAHQFGDRWGTKQNEEACQITTFDTKIPKSSVRVLSPKAKCLAGTDDADIEGDHYTMHGVRVTSPHAETQQSNGSKTPLVLLHGYANGALYFYRNFLGLQRYFGTVYSLDMLGWGLSSRPKFKTTDDTVESAEMFFVDSLEAWREAQGIDKMILAGHSLGGYVSVAYCEKYPNRVERLILLSPVGVPHKDQARSAPKGAGVSQQVLIKTLKSFWNNGITPGGFIRTISERRGRQLVEGYVDRRLPAIKSETEKSTLSEYLYTNAILPGSGEYCLNQILSPFALARKPTLNRIPNLKVSHVSFVYGETDWMESSAGLEVQKACESMNTQSGGSSAPEVEVHRVRNAGHLLMLENWEEFNSAAIISAGGGIDALHHDAPIPQKLVFETSPIDGSDYVIVEKSQS